MATPDQFETELGPDQKFILVTEGSSDTNSLQKAFKLLRPQYADFFKFIDMNEGYPFNGTGKQVDFAKGLISIGVLNRVILLFDNDTEGVRSLNLTKKLNLPRNMTATKLPNLDVLKKFATIGRRGERQQNINGKAASIECYLDLNCKPKHKALVRWSSYDKSMSRYQGVLESKGTFSKRFCAMAELDPRYDCSKIEAVFDHIYDVCVRLAAQPIRRSLESCNRPETRVP